MGTGNHHSPHYSDHDQLYHKQGRQFGFDVLWPEDGEVVVLRNGRILRVSREQAERMKERETALTWLEEVMESDPERVVQLFSQVFKTLRSREPQND